MSRSGFEKEPRRSPEKTPPQNTGAELNYFFLFEHPFTDLPKLHLRELPAGAALNLILFMSHAFEVLPLNYAIQHKIGYIHRQTLSRYLFQSVIESQIPELRLAILAPTGNEELLKMNLYPYLKQDEYFGGICSVLPQMDETQITPPAPLYAMAGIVDGYGLPKAVIRTTFYGKNKTIPVQNTSPQAA